MTTVAPELERAIAEVKADAPTEPESSSESAAKPYVCSDCGRSFATSQGLAGHAKAHADGTPGSSAKGKVKSSTKPDRAPSDPAPRKGSLRARLETHFVMLGTLVMTVERFDGLQIVKGSPELAEALDGIARENPRVKAALERFLTGSAWTAVLIATFKISAPIMAHHGMLPDRVARPLVGDLDKMERDADRDDDHPVAVVG